MARRDWGKEHRCICRLYQVGPYRLLHSYWSGLHVYTSIQACWEDILVSRSNIKHFYHYTASCPFSNLITSISLLAKKLNNGETQSPLTQCQEYYFGGDIFYDTPANTGFGTPRPKCETPGDLLLVSKHIALLLPKCFGESNRYCWILVAVSRYLKVLCFGAKVLRIFSHPGMTVGMTMPWPRKNTGWWSLWAQHYDSAMSFMRVLTKCGICCNVEWDSRGIIVYNSRWCHQMVVK